jgi:hypothetical protein
MVGMDFLKDWIITIDFDEGRIDVLPPGTKRVSKWGESIPFVYDTDGRMEMSIRATVGEKVQTPFMVDTGNTGTGHLGDALLTRLIGAREARATGDGKGVDLSGTHTSKVARLSHFSLGSFRNDNLKFTSGKQNVLGLKYMSRYRVTIDFPSQRLYLAKGRHFADHDLGHTCGLGLLFRGGGIEVESVDEKGPAKATGVRPKDVIVKLCGKSVSEWKPSEVNRLLRAEDKTVQMTVERGGRRMEMSFTPKEYD